MTIGGVALIAILFYNHTESTTTQNFHDTQQPSGSLALNLRPAKQPGFETRRCSLPSWRAIELVPLRPCRPLDSPPLRC